MPLPPSFPTAHWLAECDRLLSRSTPEQVADIAATVAIYARELAPLLVEHIVRGAALLPPGKGRLSVLSELTHSSLKPSRQQAHHVRPLLLPCLHTIPEKEIATGASLVARFGQPGDEAVLPKPWDRDTVRGLKGGFAARGWEREARALVGAWMQQALPEKRLALWLYMIDDFQPKPIDQWLLQEAWRGLTESASCEEVAALSSCAARLGQRTLAYQLLTKALQTPKPAERSWMFLGRCVGKLGGYSELSRLDPGDSAEVFYTWILVTTRNKDLALVAANQLLSLRGRDAKNASDIYHTISQAINRWMERDSRVAHQLYSLLEKVAPREECIYALPYHHYWRERNDPSAHLREILAFPTDFRRSDGLHNFVSTCLLNGLVESARKAYRHLFGAGALRSQLLFANLLRKHGYEVEVQKIVQSVKHNSLRRFTPPQLEEDPEGFSLQAGLASFLAQCHLQEGRQHLLALIVDLKVYVSWLTTTLQSSHDVLESSTYLYTSLVDAFEAAELWDDAFATIAEIPDPVAAGELLGKLGRLKRLPAVA